MTILLHYCPICTRPFATDADMKKHQRDSHNKLSRILARERAKDRGPIQCGHQGCEASFGNERDRDQHRRDKHRLMP
jgi:hypothetical protein